MKVSVLGYCKGGSRNYEVGAAIICGYRHFVVGDEDRRNILKAYEDFLGRNVC